MVMVGTPPVLRHVLGDFNVVCQHCSAVHFPGEKGARASSFGTCCNHGKVVLPPRRELWEPLNSLMNGSHAQSRHFLSNIRAYNCALQLASSGAHFERLPRGVTALRVSGEVYFQLGPLQPQQGSLPKFAQLYIYDPAGDPNTAATSEVDRRMAAFQGAGLRRDLLQELQDGMHRHNSLVQLFQGAEVRLNSANCQ